MKYYKDDKSGALECGRRKALFNFFFKPENTRSIGWMKRMISLLIENDGYSITFDEAGYIMEIICKEDLLDIDSNGNCNLTEKGLDWINEHYREFVSPWVRI